MLDVNVMTGHWHPHWLDAFIPARDTHMYVHRWVNTVCECDDWTLTSMLTWCTHTCQGNTYVHRWVKRCMWMWWLGTDIHTDLMHSYLPGVHMYVHRWVKRCMWMWWLGTDIHTDLMHSYLPGVHMYVHRWVKRCMWMWWQGTDIHADLMHSYLPGTHTCTYTGGF